MSLPTRAALEHAGGGYWRYPLTDFAFLRNMHFPTPAMLSELTQRLPELLFAYGSRQSTLDGLAARFLGCDPAHVVALHGASQIYPWLASELSQVSSPERIAAPRPTFGEYDRLFPGRSAYRDDFAFTRTDFEALDRRAHALDALVFVNPNNPTGTTLASRDLLAIADAHPRLRVIVDESFIRFTLEPSLVPLLEASPRTNVLVIQSFSKDLGVPGVRLGAAYSRDVALLTRLRAALPIWNLSALAEHLLERLVDHRAELSASLDATRHDRADLEARLATLSGITVRRGGGNFVVTSFPCDAASAAAVADRLLAEDALLVKDISPKIDDGLGHYRLAVRTPTDHTALIQALGQHLTTLTHATATRGSDSGR